MPQDQGLVGTRCGGQNGDGPGVTSTEAVNSTGAGVSGREQSADAHFSSPQCPDKRGALECYLQFNADRQRLLRSWLAMQHLPIVDLLHELTATYSAMRQLLEVTRDEQKT